MCYVCRSKAMWCVAWSMWFNIMLLSWIHTLSYHNDHDHTKPHNLQKDRWYWYHCIVHTFSVPRRAKYPPPSHQALYFCVLSQMMETPWTIKFLAWHLFQFPFHLTLTLNQKTRDIGTMANYDEEHTTSQSDWALYQWWLIKMKCCSDCFASSYERYVYACHLLCITIENIFWKK